MKVSEAIIQGSLDLCWVFLTVVETGKFEVKIAPFWRGVGCKLPENLCDFLIIVEIVDSNLIKKFGVRIVI